ncbi:hypothetical protein BJX99DRAFT_250843 [Aspergillus californicus]
MKIIIIGGGIAGSTAYLELKKHLPPHSHEQESGHENEIKIYEAYDTEVNTIHADHNDNGNTIGDSSDGNGDTRSTLVVGGGLGLFPNGLNVLKRLNVDILADVVRGGYAIAHQDLRSKNGTLLVRLDCTANPDQDPDVDANGKRMHLLGTSRHSLWSSLWMRIPECDIETKRRNEVHFVDGSSSVEADLVIGADGVKGITKRALFPEQEDIYEPEYQGLVGVGGFISTEEVRGLVEKGSMNSLFGGNGFFGYFFSNSAPSAPNRDSIYHTSNWNDPVLQKILRSLDVKSMYPTWTSPRLSTWERDGVVLVGDAAHALPSTSGQGSSQALEDVEAFAILLGHFIRGLYSILEDAQRKQNSKRGMGVIAEYAMYCVMWIAGCFPAMMSRPLKRVINHDISKEINDYIKRQE